MKGSNILVREEGADHSFHLVDLAAMRFRPPRRADVVRSLAQLHASIPFSITPADRLRFLRRFLARTGAPWEERALIRRILRRSARKSQVWERM